jgi:predicted nucleic acid-binding protein
MINAYIDSCIFVSSINKKEKEYQKCKDFFEYIFENVHEINLFTSYFTHLEVVCAFKRRNPKQFKKMYKTWLVRQATRIRPLYPKKRKEVPLYDLIINFIPTIEKFSERAMDTIHIHTALKHKMDFVITNNTKHFQKISSNKIKVFSPEEFINFHSKKLHLQKGQLVFDFSNKDLLFKKN